jgi:hypothetical protein
MGRHVGWALIVGLDRRAQTKKKQSEIAKQNNKTLIYDEDP